MNEPPLLTDLSLSSVQPRLRYISRNLLFLVYLPLFHGTFANLVIYSLGAFQWPWLFNVYIRLWIIGVVCLCLVIVLEKLWLKRDDEASTRQFIFKYYACAVLSLLVLQPILSNELLDNNFAAQTPVGGVVILLFEVLLAAALRFVLRQQQLNGMLLLSYKSAQYQTLRAQLNPHFLFNTLNMASAEITTDPQRASLVLDELADLMRGILVAVEKPTIPVSEELALLENYLKLQKMRFGQRLDYEIDVEPIWRSAHMPPMLLQPLVENSIQHGIAPRARGGSIRISVKGTDGSLHIDVTDDGVGFDPKTQAFGHGLSIVRDHISLLHGHDLDTGKDNFQVTSSPGAGTKISLCIPVDRQLISAGAD